MTINQRSLIGAQTALLESFDDDIDVEIRQDRRLHITSAKAPGIDYVLMLSNYVAGSNRDTAYHVGTSHCLPTAETAVITAEAVIERILQWRSTLELAKQKQMLATKPLFNATVTPGK